MTTFLKITRDASLILVTVGLFQVALINAFLFPTCNRTNNDCFLIERLWGGKAPVTPEESDKLVADSITYKWEGNHADR